MFSPARSCSFVVLVTLPTGEQPHSGTAQFSGENIRKCACGGQWPTSEHSICLYEVADSLQPIAWHLQQHGWSACGRGSVPSSHHGQNVVSSPISLHRTVRKGRASGRVLPQCFLGLAAFWSSSCRTSFISHRSFASCHVTRVSAFLRSTAMRSDKKEPLSLLISKAEVWGKAREQKMSAIRLNQKIRFDQWIFHIISIAITSNNVLKHKKTKAKLLVLLYSDCYIWYSKND